MALFSYHKFTAQPSLEKNDCSIAAIYSPINTFGVMLPLAQNPGQQNTKNCIENQFNAASCVQAK